MQAEALAHHLKLTDGRSGYVELAADGFRVHVRKRWPGRQLATWDGLPVEWNENVGTNKAANRWTAALLTPVCRGHSAC